MCGIIGYIGNEDAAEILLDGLKRLEYRGYDSAGIATIDGEHISIKRIKGNIALLEKVLEEKPIYGKIGLGHTRWATHGQPSEENAHPHRDCTGTIVIVHNGIIENYLLLKEKLKKRGHRFKSETDTEIIAHLIEEYYHSGVVHRSCDDLEKAVRRALKKIEGSYALGIMSSREPDKLIATRNGSPLIIGLKDGNYFIASDVPAILRHTKDIIYLEDGELAILARTGVRLYGQNGKLIRLERRIKRISWDVNMAEKEGYPHFMLKEIHEQPRAIEDTILGRISPDGADIHLEEMALNKNKLKKINRIIITACGTSWHAGLIGEYLIEEIARIPVEVENAAEFRYRNPIITDDTLAIAISQSGETADTLGAIREVHQKKGRVISICNVVGSSVVRESDAVIYTHAGPEIGVASTKAFTTQLTVLYILAVYFGKIKGTLNAEQAKKMIADLRRLPQKTEEMLKQEKEVIKIANKFYRHRNAIYLGRGKGYPVALEGALKLKEVSYIHAEGYPAAEMKHGPIALIDKNMPVIVLALKGSRYDKILANIEEVKARGGVVIALATMGDRKIKEKVDEVLYVPETSIPLSPILAVIPLQLLAYYIAVKRKCNPDQPRHLAKSVTVE
ncbi:glutamine--fructose-6-phosphate aminotransferase [Candidatus Desantisbacteria bacterium CG1_02_38_46]|uniref:Glutamine--fructose-6-phosphate aminotransferase [isomerizing] n=3 Tax=unclassified Candidatus Desantisiibacteriota TaxID=3106372 RepID=A0A2H9PC78_9BACT|nr:MAG: glutamine--fructose-6-phosphate aminotransferase [Candidatus Desantisbacteria bacterium CG1_02_38_46]PIU51496.1 MAG: glutamine--fructose-6-phosphate transaminase (isomerizing) [Candidatus Desantisbacteria bacterium CG07_land_8_20_14_0_80_39_15]PIZ16705.1 MAG: glutamine--fructose-6-phosphate transaminase (isomerizing) [Candidatus Desantisbacteria bacterium CG_4_10_14_0_8_um_filter_39_17]